MRQTRSFYLTQTLVLGLFLQVSYAQLFTAPHGIGGRWNLYEVRGNGVGAPLTWWDAHVAATNAIDPLGFTGTRGHLVSTLTAQENRDVSIMGGGGDIWIGLTDNGLFGGVEAGANPNGGWVWTSGEPFAYQNFGGGEPNDSGSEDAVHLRGDQMWNDHKSNIPLSGETAGPPSNKYVIEWNVNSPVPIPGATVILATPSVNLTPVAGFDTLDITIHAEGTVTADLPILGMTDIPINTMDTQAANLGGYQNAEFTLDFDPTNHLGTATAIEMTDGDIEVQNDPVFTLDLGFFLFVNLGDVVVTGENIHAHLDTPNPPSTITGGQSALADHDFVLDQGVIGGGATGIAGDFLAPFRVDLAATPLSGSVGNGNANVTVGAPVVIGTVATYPIQVEVPVNFSELFLTDPVNVTVSIAGTVRFAGSYVRQLPDWDMDGIIDVIDPDDDNDTLPDLWEMRYTMPVLGSNDVTIDIDGDGFTLGQEYVTDTHPTNGLSYQWLTIDTTSLEEEQSLIFNSSSLRRYWIEARPSLLGGNWTCTHTNITGNDAIFNQFETNLLDRAYYRLGVQIP